jgi:hypothetical protein
MLMNKHSDITDLFEQYLDKNRFYSFEGERGVRNITQIVKEISGYDSLGKFLADNPAACEAIVEHIRDYLPTVPEWREDLIALMNDEE